MSLSTLPRCIETADDLWALPEKTEQPITIQQAVDEYLADAEARDSRSHALFRHRSAQR